MSDLAAWLTPAEVAAIMGVSEVTVCRWCRAGRIEAKRTSSGGHWRVYGPAVEKILQGR